MRIALQARFSFELAFELYAVDQVSRDLSILVEVAYQ